MYLPVLGQAGFGAYDPHVAVQNYYPGNHQNTGNHLSIDIHEQPVCAYMLDALD